MRKLLQNLVAAPVIETERLILRGLQASDFDAFHEMHTDPQVYHFLTGKPLSKEDAWARMLRLTGLWNLVGHGYWALENKPTSQLAGFAQFHRELATAMPEPEAGWALASAWHGQGYATEAMQVITDWGDQLIDAPQTACMIEPENLTSQKLAQKLGYVLAVETNYKDNPVQLFHRQRVIKPLL